jgi:hypothetical protein
VAIKSPANQRHVVFNDAATLPLGRLRAERELVLAAIPIRELPRSGIRPLQTQYPVTFSQTGC